LRFARPRVTHYLRNGDDFNNTKNQEYNSGRTSRAS
jgi:hypothetical protein